MGGEYLQLVGWEWCGDGKEFPFSRKNSKNWLFWVPPSPLTFREMCKLTNQSFSHLLVWFRELCETNPGDNLMDSWIERTWIIQTWISNTILSVFEKREKEDKTKRPFYWNFFNRSIRGGGHSASERAHFRHFQRVSETVFFVFSLNLIHIVILFCPLWFRKRKYGRFMALFIFQWPKKEQN